MSQYGPDQRPPPVTGPITVAPTGPERPGLAGSLGFRVGLLVVSTGALIGIALLAARSGPWVGRDQNPSMSPPQLTLRTVPTVPRVTVTPDVRPQAPSSPTNFTPWLIGLAVLLGAALLLMLVLWWRQRDRRVGPPDEGEPAEGPPMLSEPEEGSAEMPFDARVAADQIITSWQEVEGTAEWAGRRRRPQQTPTEFLEAAVAGLPVEAAAQATLLHLYHQARFDVRALGPESARAAYVAAERICSGLRYAGTALLTGPAAAALDTVPPGERP